jgi:hypothetical protein
LRSYHSVSNDSSVLQAAQGGGVRERLPEHLPAAAAWPL